MGAVSSHLRDACDWLGERLGADKPLRLLIVGLDAVGKTTLLYRLKLGETVRAIPTVGFNVEDFAHGHVPWEVGGGDKIRPLWRHYFLDTRAVVFVVDATDRDRLHEAKDALHFMFASDEINHAPLLVLANKQDVSGATTAADVACGLELFKLQKSPCIVIPVAVAEGTGLTDALDWLALQLTGKPATRATYR